MHLIHITKAVLYDGFAGCCHIEAAEEREAFLRALMEKQEEAGDGRRKLIQWNSGVDERRES